MEKALALFSGGQDSATCLAWACERFDHVETLGFDYGVEIVRLCMAAYLSAERGQTVDLTDEATLRELENYVPLIQQGRGAELVASGVLQHGLEKRPLDSLHHLVIHLAGCGAR